MASDRDPGVPEALPRALAALAEQVEPGSMHRIWIFPPLRRGRRETGLVAVAAYLGGEGRLLATLGWIAEETGEGVRFETSYQEEGEAPQERMPAIMKGVVSRLAEDPGDPDDHLIEGDPERFASLLARRASVSGSDVASLPTRERNRA